VKVRLLWFKVGLILTFIFLLVLTGAVAKGSFSASFKPKQPAKLVIDTGGEVNMSKCAPCHRDLDRGQTSVRGQTSASVARGGAPRGGGGGARGVGGGVGGGGFSGMI
jgi:hypothetical protein